MMAVGCDLSSGVRASAANMKTRRLPLGRAMASEAMMKSVAEQDFEAAIVASIAVVAKGGLGFSSGVKLSE